MIQKYVEAIQFNCKVQTDAINLLVGPTVILLIGKGWCVFCQEFYCKPVNIEVITESMFPLTVVMSVV